jgi:hypothetical protein
MNNYIKNLVEKHERILNLYSIGPVQRAEVEDFAEDIARQCIFEMVQESLLTDNQQVQDFTVDVAQRIVDRFGVKEKVKVKERIRNRSTYFGNDI